jgi:hypothetical protein
VFEAPIADSSPETGGYGLSGCSVLVPVGDRLVRSFCARAGEVAWSVAVARDDVSGVQLSADPANRLMVNVGSVPAVPAKPLGWGQAHRPLLPSGRGGGPVVVVAVTRHQGGRESRPQGERVQSARSTTGPKQLAGKHWRSALERALHNQRLLHEPGSNTTPTLCAHQSRMRSKSHVRFGARRRGNHRPKSRHRRPAADPACDRLLSGRHRRPISRPSATLASVGLDPRRVPLSPASGCLAAK